MLMQNEAPEGDDSQLPNRMKLIVVLPSLAVGGYIFAYYAWLGLTTGYSYWLDEIFSVVTSDEGVGRAISFTFQDVHPPFYQIILANWIEFFDNAETATRMLSMVFAVASLGALATLPRSVLSAGTIALIIAFYLPNAFFNFYAQETRSYGMLMFLSCLALNGIVRASNPLMLVSAVLLGFTHFFGTLLGILLLAYVLFNAPTRRQMALSILVGTSIIAWPVAQMLFSRTGELLGGDFWIGTGAKDSVLQAVSTLWQPLYKPFFDGLSAMSLDGKWLSALCALGILFFLVYVGRNRGGAKDEASDRFALKRVSAVVASFVLVVAFLSLHTPISTSRNYTVLIPFSTFILAVAASRALNRKGLLGVLTAAGCFAFVGISIQLTSSRMEQKIASENSLRNLMAVASEVAIENDISMYHLPGDGPWTTPIYNYYVANGLSVSPLPENTNLPDKFELIYILESCARISRFLNTISQGYRIVYVEGRSPDDCNYANGVVSLHRM